MAEAKPRNRRLGPADLQRLAKVLDLYAGPEGVESFELLGSLSFLEYRVYPEGWLIVEEGSTGSELFIMSIGSAVLSREGKQLARLSPGDFFGDVGFSTGDPSPRQATVTAGEHCELFRCEPGGFAEIIDRHPTLAQAIGFLARLSKED